MTALNIDVICANTPSAKGRVERAHLTLPDRLGKELRLAGLSSIEQGNAFIDAGYVDAFNERFGREPVSPHDAPRNRDDERPASRANGRGVLGAHSDSSSSRAPLASKCSTKCTTGMAKGSSGSSKRSSVGQE